MGRSWMTRFWACFLVLGALSLGTVGQDATAVDGSFTADLDGRKTWTLRYGIGDVQGLAGHQLSPGRLVLDQTLAVDVRAEALGTLLLVGHFDDQQPESMQTLTLHLDAGDLQGVFGDFSISGAGTFAVYNKKLLGAKVDYRLGEALLTGILSRVEGISESKTFVGESAEGSTLISEYPPGEPWTRQPYLRHIDGLVHFDLMAPFVEGFSRVGLGLTPSAALDSLLASFGLGYLRDQLAASPTDDLSAATYVVVAASADVLILKRAPDALLRDRLRDAIKDYNAENGLTGSEKRRYPFNVDSDYESAFLGRLSAHAFLDVEGDRYSLGERGQRRFYDLGFEEIKPETLLVEVSVAGGTFRPVSDPDLAAYETTLHAEPGILEIAFPEAFFALRESALRASFSYSISGEVLSLGLSLVPESERVYLNETLLARDADYSIDYETGTLWLIVELKETDVLRVDFERSRGGLGSGAEYARDFYGATVAFPVSDALEIEVSLLQAADVEGPDLDRSRLRTMPNRHTVGGVTGTVDVEGFSAQFAFGMNHDEFPFDDNQREYLPNRTTSIVVVSEYAVIGHLGGLAVRREGGWTSYDTSDGLSGSRVHAMVTDGDALFIGTGSGLTVLTLDGEAPFDRVANWRRFYESDGLPDAAVRSLFLDGETLWIGTEAGLASAPVDALDDRSQWQVWVDDALTDLGAITALDAVGDSLTLGTERGLYRYQLSAAHLARIDEAGDAAIHDLLRFGGDLYIAGDDGLLRLSGGVGRWVVTGETVYALASADERLFYGTEAGLVEDGILPPVLTGLPIPAVASDVRGGVWAGGIADSSYEMSVWRVSDGVERFDRRVTGIDGRDLGRFADVAPDEHTDRGTTSRFSFQSGDEVFSLDGTFELVSPDFTSIGRTGRRDVVGWDLRGTLIPFEGGNVALTHAFHRFDQQLGRPRTTMDNGLSLSWSFGPSLNLSFQQNLVNDDHEHRGMDRTSLNYSVRLSDRLFDDRLALSLAWSDAFTDSFVTGSQRRSNTLSIDANVELLPGLGWIGRWSRPLSFSEWSVSGSETRFVSLRWTQSWEDLMANGFYERDENLTLPAATSRVIQKAEVSVRHAAMEIEGLSLKVTPSVTATWHDDDGSVRVGGRGSLAAELDGLSGQASYRRDVSYRDWVPLQDGDTVSLSLSYAEIPAVRPSLTFSQNVAGVLSEGIVRADVNRTITGRMTWTPDSGLYDDLSVSLVSHSSDRSEEESFTVSVRNTLSMPLGEMLTTRVEVEGRYEESNGETDLSGSLVGNVGATLTETWSGSFTVSYLTGTKADDDLYHGLIFELNVAATF